jgi:3'-5' exoribonuclease
VSKQVFLRDVAPGARLQGEPFLLSDLAVEIGRNGRPYLAFTVQDRTGRLAGRWTALDSDLVDDLDAGAGVRVTGVIVERQGTRTIEAEALAAHELADWNDYLPASPRPRAEMEAELRARIRALRTPLGELAAAVALEPEFLARFLRAPAARQLHHACIGGLAEHTLAVAALCEVYAARYPQADRDLLLAAALLHDAGKIYEYSAEPSFAHTLEGRLVGHIVLIAARVSAAVAARGDVPAALRVRLLHAIIAHHGRLEYGSPVMPATLEAILLHQADVVDSQARGFLDHVAREERRPGAWTDYSRMFGTELLRPD